MPTPPTAATVPVFDAAQLNRHTRGNPRLQVEVLSLFLTEVESLAAAHGAIRDLRTISTTTQEFRIAQVADCVDCHAANQRLRAERCGSATFGFELRVALVRLTPHF